jgi:hypothetical protein
MFNLSQTSVYVNARRKTPLEIQFVYLGNKEIYLIFQTCCIINKEKKLINDT